MVNPTTTVIATALVMAMETATAIARVLRTTTATAIVRADPIKTATATVPFLLKVRHRHLNPPQRWRAVYYRDWEVPFCSKSTTAWVYGI